MNIPAKFSLFAAFVLFSSLLNAQNAPADKSRVVNPKTESRYGQSDQDLAKELNLSKEQDEQFQKINRDYKAKSKAAHDARKQESKKMRDERSAAHKAILNAEQARKYDEVMAKRHEKKEGRKADRKAEHKEGKKARKPSAPAGQK